MFETVTFVHLTDADRLRVEKDKDHFYEKVNHYRVTSESWDPAQEAWVAQEFGGKDFYVPKKT